MKRFLLSIALILTLAVPSWAIKTYNCDYLTGGAARALDYISVNDLSNGDRAILVTPQKEYIYFRFVTSGVTAENTSAHPYYVRPNDYVSHGVWEECSVKWMDYNTDLTARSLDTSGYGNITGNMPTPNITTSETISGTSLYGAMIGNYGALSEVTYTLSACRDGMNLGFQLRQDQTSGSTIVVVINASDTAYGGVSNFSAGHSAYVLSGTTMAAYATFNHGGTSIWCVQGTGITGRNK
jgi:hypothetical protein